MSVWKFNWVSSTLDSGFWWAPLMINQYKLFVIIIIFIIIICYYRYYTCIVINKFEASIFAASSGRFTAYTQKNPTDLCLFHLLLHDLVILLTAIKHFHLPAIVTWTHHELSLCTLGLLKDLTERHSRLVETIIFVLKLQITISLVSLLFLLSWVPVIILCTFLCNDCFLVFFLGSKRPVETSNEDVKSKMEVWYWYLYLSITERCIAGLSKHF